MRTFAVIMVALAVSVWWHPLPVAAQCCALLALAVACLAFRSVNKRAEVLRQKLAELREAVEPLGNRDDS
jgi:hypothetical protein